MRRDGTGQTQHTVTLALTSSSPRSTCPSSSLSPTCISSSQGLLCPGSTKAQPTPSTRVSSAKSLQLGQARDLALKLMQPKSTLDCNWSRPRVLCNSTSQGILTLS